MTDPTLPKLSVSQRLKIMSVEIFSALAKIVVAIGILALFQQLPLIMGIAFYALGIVATHIWVFKGIVRAKGEEPGLSDIGSYFKDSGIAIIVLGWPISVPFTILPEIIEPRLEKLFGISWNQGKRIFT